VNWLWIDRSMGARIQRSLLRQKSRDDPVVVQFENPKTAPLPTILAILHDNTTE